MGDVIDGGLVGVGNRLLSGVAGQWARPVSLFAVGTYRRNSTLTTLAGLAAGEQLANMVPLPSLGGLLPSGGGGGISLPPTLA